MDEDRVGVSHDEPPPPADILREQIGEIVERVSPEPGAARVRQPHREALDPRATLQIEDLMADLKKRYTIIIVTHNMQQAARASDHTIFMNMGDDRAGYLVEQGPTTRIFTSPRDTLTEDYVSGRFG